MGIEKGFCAACEKPDRRLAVLSTNYKCLDCGGEFTHYAAVAKIAGGICKTCGTLRDNTWKVSGELETGRLSICPKCETRYIEYEEVKDGG